MKKGEIARYAGALGVGGAAAKFGIENQEALASLPWQKMMPYVEIGLSVYGVGEVENLLDEIKEIKAAGEKPHFLEYVGKGLRSVPALSLPIGLVTKNNPLYSSVLPAMACTLGYMADGLGKSRRIKKRKSKYGEF